MGVVQVVAGAGEGVVVGGGGSALVPGFDVVDLAELGGPVAVVVDAVLVAGDEVVA